MKKELTLRYFHPAPRTLEGWEQYSMPIGNGYCGACVFGGTDVERVQFTTNAFANDKKMAACLILPSYTYIFQTGISPNMSGAYVCVTVQHILIIFLTVFRFIERLFSVLLTKFTGNLYGFMFFSTKRLIKKIKKIKPDVVHLHCLNAYTANLKMLFLFLAKENT